MTKSKSKVKRGDKSPVAKDGSESDSSKMGSVPESPVSATSSVTLATPSVTPTHHSSPQIHRPTPTAWFTAEIQQMMHGFGDCRRPLLECASIIEEIVHEQLTVMLHQAAEVAGARNARFTSLEDFLFLLRKDKNKLRRLIKYMKFKDINSAIRTGNIDEEETPEVPVGDGKQPPKKKRKIAYDFISSIDQTGELLVLFEDDSVDEIKHERALRAELQTRHMDAQQYLDFCTSRQASFSPRFNKSQRFRDWLMAGITLEPKPNPLAIEVLSCMAFETVAQIVDLALIVKRDMQGTVADPFLQMMPTICVNHEMVAGPQPVPTAPNRSPSRAPSPITSPPSTPTTSAPAVTMVTTPSSQTPTGLSSSGGATKAKSKKRKKSGSQTSRDLYATQALQPCQIREALRRYGQALGPFADFSKQPLLSVKQRIFCA